MKKIFTFVITFLMLVFPQTANAALIHDVGVDSSSYSIRIDGEAAGYAISDQVIAADLNNNGKNDLIISDFNGDSNSRADSGSVYIIYDDILDDYTGSGNVISLATSSKYNIRYDGELAGDQLGSRGGIAVGDIDNDGKLDLLMGARNADFNSRSSSGSLYVIKNTLIDDYSGTGNNVDLTTSTNYNLRYDGAVAGNNFSTGNAAVADIDNDGKGDILVGKGTGGNGILYIIYNTLIDDYVGTGNNIDMLTTSNYNIAYSAPAGAQLPKDGLFVGDMDNDGKKDLLLSGTNTDKAFIIYNTLIDDYVGTGNAVSLSTSTNYNIRFDATSGDGLGAEGTFAADLDDNGKLDILIGAINTDFNSTTNSGSVYVIYDGIFSSLSGTGNVLSLATSTSYSVRYDGAASSDSLVSVVSDDIDADGKNDVLMSAGFTDYGGVSNRGSLYVLNNDDVNVFAQVTGRTIQLNDDSKYSTRYDGAMADDNFTEPKGVSTGDINNDGIADIFVQAFVTDFNGSGSGSVYIIYGRRRVDTPSSSTYSSGPDVLANSFGIMTNNNVTSIVNANTLPWASFMSVDTTPQTVFRVPGTQYWQSSPIYEIWHRAFSNKAKILPQEVKKPFTIAIRYIPSQISKNLSEKRLKLAFSTDNKKWKILNSVLDIKNKTVSVVTKSGGYYMLVSGYPATVAPTTQVQVEVNETKDVQTRVEITPQPAPAPTPQAPLPPQKRCFLFFCW